MNKEKTKKQKRKQSEERRLDKPFKITSVCRADLMEDGAGLSRTAALRVTDAQMERIASKMADDYCNQLFWSSLPIITEYVLE